METKFIIILIIAILGLASFSVLLFHFIRLKSEHKRLLGLLESEKLKKEVLRKESNLAFQMKEEFEKKLEESINLMKEMETDILLLQKDNEATESLLQTTQPELYQLKMKLIEANNTISRLKANINQS